MNLARTMVARVPALGWILLLAAALLLPRLGAFGFWEPWEARVADPATAEAARLAPATGALLAAGARLGTSEASARLLFALTGLAAVLAVWWAGVGLVGRRAAVISAAVLVTMPLFSFQARQLISDMPLVLGLALALGGLGRFVWAGRRAVDLLVGAAGMVLGWQSGGALMGVAVPCAAAAAAILIAGAPGLPRTRWVLLAGLGAVALLTMAGGLLRTHTAGLYSGLLGGAPRLLGSTGAPLTFEWLIRQLGFGLFPWSGLVFFALAEPLVADAEGEAAPATGPRHFLLFFAVFGCVVATVRGYMVGEGRFAALAPIALALGAFLDQPTERKGPERIVALLAGVGTILVARDLFLGPEELFSVHTLEKVTWPPTLDGKVVLLATGICFALALWIGVGMRRRVGTWAAVGVAVVFSALLVQGMVPALSRHLSPRKVVDAYRRAATGGEVLARYRVAGDGASALRSAPGPMLHSLPELVAHLSPSSGSARAFAVIAADQLASVDEALKVAGRPYAVLDASSSRLLLLTNRLSPGQEEQNPLRRHVFMPAAPDDRPPWPPPRVVRTTVFAGAVQLLGADFPTSVQRPGSFHLTLFFRVLARPPAAHNIFVHLARPGQALINGDHAPVGGTFPTAHWVPGEYIRDEHKIDLPLAVTSAGRYELFVGLWPGGNRPGVKITAGENDGHDRAPLGTVVIQ